MTGRGGAVAGVRAASAAVGPGMSGTWTQPLQAPDTQARGQRAPGHDAQGSAEVWGAASAQHWCLTRETVRGHRVECGKRRGVSVGHGLPSEQVKARRDRGATVGTEEPPRMVAAGRGGAVRSRLCCLCQMLRRPRMKVTLSCKRRPRKSSPGDVQDSLSCRRGLDAACLSRPRPPEGEKWQPGCGPGVRALGRLPVPKALRAPRLKAQPARSQEEARTEAPTQEGTAHRCFQSPGRAGAERWEACQRAGSPGLWGPQEATADGLRCPQPEAGEPQDAEAPAGPHVHSHPSRAPVPSAEGGRLSAFHGDTCPRSEMQEDPWAESRGERLGSRPQRGLEGRFSTNHQQAVPGTALCASWLRPAHITQLPAPSSWQSSLHLPRTLTLPLEASHHRQSLQKVREGGQQR